MKENYILYYNIVLEDNYSAYLQPKTN